MILAHGLGGAGGPEIEALLLGVAITGLGIQALRKNPKSYVAIAMTVAGAVLFVGAFTFFTSDATLEAPTGVTVAITYPEDGSTVTTDQDVQVEVDLEGAELTNETSGDDPRKGHIHVFVDDAMVSMPTTLESNIDLEPGDHTITVEFVGADHSQFEPRILDSVDVTAE